MADSIYPGQKRLTKPLIKEQTDNINPSDKSAIAPSLVSSRRRQKKFVETTY